MAEQRPNPEKLLQRVQVEARKETRGKLKIYLGAAPGVGKTHTMLYDALQERSKGLDIIVGVAESHGRQNIEAMIKEFEVLARQTVEYHGKQLTEFNLDAALKRSPGLILMDEMAHTNVPHLRHAKRWQDIKELLDRGINVYTTLNVQHIESLSDDVAQIIHAPIKETVPDSMIEMADTIELVDIPPDELLKRLHEGKVYFPEQATLAAEHFFRKGNLIALRELALRETAELVGSEVLLYRQSEGIKYIWPTKDKILVCVGPKPESLKLIRAAKRIAHSLQAKWIAVYIDTSEKNRNNAIQNLRLAEQLGAETRVLAGFDIVKEVMSFAREQNVTQIMIWKHIHTRWRDWFRRNLADEVVRHSGEIDVYIMTGEEISNVNPQNNPSLTHQTPWKIYGIAIGLLTLIGLTGFIFFPILSPSNLIMLYLLGVTLIILFGRSRRQTELAHRIQHRTSALYTLSRQLASLRGIDKLLEAGTRYIADNFECDVLALLPKNSHLEIRGNTKSKQSQLLDTKELGIAQWVYELGQMAGFGTDTLSFSKALYMPLLASLGPIGVLRIYPRNQQLFTPEQMQFIETCASQIALALDVDRLHEQTQQKELQTAIDDVRSTLLQSISHDLRTPLLSIMAAASTLMETKTAKIRDLGKIIYTETEQLSRLINNLLQITYLESQDVKLQIKPSSLNDIIKISTEKLKDRPVNITIPENLPLIPFDNTLIQEVFFNLIDNAIKFTPPKSPLTIYVTLEKNWVIISIEDCGPGIMPDEVDRLFEKFYRGRLLTSERGLGLGLAICRSIIEAHGGRIWAQNCREGGAAFRFTLPLRQSQ